jgi:hypothetical protein
MSMFLTNCLAKFAKHKKGSYSTRKKFNKRVIKNYLSLNSRIIEKESVMPLHDMIFKNEILA